MRRHRRALVAGMAMMGAGAGAGAGAAWGDTITFRQDAALPGGGTYSGAVDTYIRSDNAGTSYGGTTPLLIDGDVTAGSVAQGLIRFDNIFGSGAGRIPFGSAINRATLTFTTSNTSVDHMGLYRLNTTWSGASTWNSLVNGVNAGDYVTTPDGLRTPRAVGTATYNVTAAMQAWSSGQANNGWALLPSGTDGWQPHSAESSTSSARPTLAVDYGPRQAPRNVILFVGDGMGTEAIKAARYHAGAPMSFEGFANQGLMTHNNVADLVTDSAASGTAMATGQKANNGVISVRAPGDGGEMQTVLEILRDRGKRTGLVTAATGITDATPASFGAHDSSRNNSAAIATDMLNQTRPNVLIGQPGGMTVSAAQTAGYQVVQTASALSTLDANAYSHVAGLFSSGAEPALSASTAKALDILDNDPDGFFLLVENEQTDNAGHSNDIAGVISGVQSLSAAVQQALTWANGRTDTLILVVADHETGGLTVTANNGAGNLPTVNWSTTGHTTTPVTIFALGPNADMVGGTLDNADMFSILTVPEPSGVASLLIPLAGVVLRRRKRA